MIEQIKGQSKSFLITGAIALMIVLSVVSCKPEALANPNAETLYPTQGSPLTEKPAITPLESVSSQSISRPVSPGTPRSATTTPGVTTPLFTPSAMTATVSRTPIKSATTIPTNVHQTGTPVAPCNQMGNLVDITIPAGAQIIAGQAFKKIWSIQNTGSCTWDSDYRLVLPAGMLIYPYRSIELGEEVSPGMVMPIAIDVIAPMAAGGYFDAWKLVTDDGEPLTDENGIELDFAISIIVIPNTAQITGRITVGGVSAGPGVFLSLEDQVNQIIATTVTLEGGTYTWTDIPASDQGYNIVFSQAANSQYGMDQVLSWVWVGPIAVREGETIQLVDIDISRLGFSQSSPEPEAVFPKSAISPANPLIFLWSGYPGAIDYWVDLVRGENESVWQSPLVSTQSVAFNGILSNGAQIQPDEYWWAVGARRWLDAYPQVVYTYLTSLVIED